MGGARKQVVTVAWPSIGEAEWISVRPVIQVVSRMKPEQVIATLSLRDVHHAYGIVDQNR